MSKIERYQFVSSPDETGLVMMRPFLPIQLHNQSLQSAVAADGLLDTGSTVNVLPYNMGVELELIWPEDDIPIVLTGNLANDEARRIVVVGRIGTWPLVPLVFAWTKAKNARLILGQINFFARFNVCFFQSQNYFEIQQSG